MKALLRKLIRLTILRFAKTDLVGREKTLVASLEVSARADMAKIKLAMNDFLSW